MADNTQPPAHLNPAAGTFAPGNGPQVSSISFLDLQFKVEDLEREQGCTRIEISELKSLCLTLCTEIETLKKGGCNVAVCPFQDQPDTRFAKALDAVDERADGGAVLPQDALSGCCTNANVSKKKSAGVTKPHQPSQDGSFSNKFIPPHLRKKNGAGPAALPPHQRTGSASGLVSFLATG